MTKEPMMITITLEEYESLLDDARMLECLRAAGVDNWIGWDFALEAFYEDENQ